MGRRKAACPSKHARGDVFPGEGQTAMQQVLWKENRLHLEPILLLLRPRSPDYLWFPLCVLPLPTVTHRKWRNGDETCLPLSDQLRHWGHRPALPTLPLGKQHQVPPPATSPETETSPWMPLLYARRSVCCIPLPWIKPPHFPLPEIARASVRMTHLCIWRHVYSHTRTHLTCWEPVAKISLSFWAPWFTRFCEVLSKRGENKVKTKS